MHRFAQFEAALRREAKRLAIESWPESIKPAEHERTFHRDRRDKLGFYSLTPGLRGVLVARLFADAEADGASRIEFWYGSNKIVCYIEDEEFAISPPPPPEVAYISIALARSCRVGLNASVPLALGFADTTLHLTVSHLIDRGDERIEVSGFTAGPARIARFRAALLEKPPPPV